MNANATATFAPPTTPVDYARAVIDTIMREFDAHELHPVGHFGYVRGVFLSGVWNIYEITGEERYAQYVKDWMDSVIHPSGEILDYHHGDLDDMQPAILLFRLMDKYGDAKYRKALDKVVAVFPDIPKGPTGGFWHKMRRNSQMWLDGLYMGGPLMAEYARRYDVPVMRQELIHQVTEMFERTRNPATGLLFHAWDARKVAPWADPQTGTSPEHWGRSVGWVPVALFDDADQFDPGSDEHAVLVRSAVDLLRAVVRYQAEDGRWYQVIDKGGQAGNWLENSCTALFAAALAKAVRLGYVDGDEASTWEAAARRGFDGIVRSVEWDGPNLRVGAICVGTGAGDYDFYCARPTAVNDLHGLGAFLLMCAELDRLGA